MFGVLANFDPALFLKTSILMIRIALKIGEEALQSKLLQR
jgi:hypothetical protein